MPNDDTVAPFSTSQFQPPSASCSPRSRSTSGAMSTPKYAPVATTLPLMHGSTSPSKNGFLAHGRDERGAVAPGDVLADQADGPPGLLARRDRARTAAGARGRGTCPSSRDPRPCRPTGHPAPGARAAGRPSPPWRSSPARRRRRRPVRGSDHASPASGSPGRSRAANRRLSCHPSSQANMTAAVRDPRLRAGDLVAPADAVRRVCLLDIPRRGPSLRRGDLGAGVAIGLSVTDALPLARAIRASQRWVAAIWRSDIWAAR